MKKKTILCLIGAFCLFNLFGNTEIDSLEAVFKTSKEKSKASILNKLAYQYLEYDLDMTLDCALQAYDLAQKYKNKDEEAKAADLIGIYYRKKRDYPASLSYFQKSLEIRKILGDQEAIGKALFAISHVYNFQGDFNKALDTYFESLDIFYPLNNGYYISSIYNDIGICYNRLGDYQDALEYYYKALDLKEDLLKSGEEANKIKIESTLNNIGNVHLRLGEFDKALEIFLKFLEGENDDIIQSKLLNNIGIAYQEMGDLEKALFYYQRALSLNRKLDLKDKIAASLNNIGYIYDMQKDWNTTLAYYQQALTLKEEIGDQFGIANGQKNVGSIFLEMKQYNTALSYLRKSIELAENIGAQEILKDNYKYLSRLFHEQNNYKTAFECEQKYSAIKDSLFHESMAEKLAAIETNYMIVKAEKEKEILIKDNLLYKFDIQKVNLEKLRSYILVLLLLLLSMIITFAYYQKRAINKILQKSKANLEIEVEHRTIELAKTNTDLLNEIEERKKAEIIITDSLKEKEVMLREIHHRVKNNLQIISSILNLQTYDEIDDKSLSILENTRNRVYSMSLIHEKLYMERNLAQIEFKDYISGLLNYLLGNYQFDSKRIDVKLEIKKVFLNLDTAIPCGLLINEIFTNSIKHAFQNMEEGLVTIQMFKDKKNYFNLIIGDNGNIIHSEEELINHKSIGMQLIKLLAKQINSELIIDVSGGVKYIFKFKEK
ncbi:MAG: tetratricopeptide repeat protein [Candidatus Cloacimonadales bacterium]|nr:tetratricopeptide repeat protein [Candidatus Cloacimonadales bacterium]